MFSRRPLRKAVPILAVADQTDRCLIATLTVRSVTHRQSDALRSEAQALLDRTENLVLDLDGVSCMDSAGLGAMVCIVKAAREAGKNASLCRLPDDVRVLVELVRLHELIDIYNDRDEALRAAAAVPVDRVDQLLDAVEPSGLEVDPETVPVVTSDLLESLR